MEDSFVIWTNTTGMTHLKIDMEEFKNPERWSCSCSSWRELLPDEILEPNTQNALFSFFLSEQFLLDVEADLCARCSREPKQAPYH